MGGVERRYKYPACVGLDGVADWGRGRGQHVMGFFVVWTGLSVLYAADRPPPAESVQAVLSALTQIADGERSCRALKIRYRDGSDALGWTTLHVRNGWVRVKRMEPGQTEGVLHRGRLVRAMCHRLVRNVVDGELFRARARRRDPLPNETKPEIRVGVHDVGRFTVSLWGFDVQDTRAFAVARGELLILARNISGGAVRY